VILYVAAATSFNGYDKCPDKDGKDENKIAKAQLDAAVKKTYAQLLQSHIKDYKKYFDRVDLSFGESFANNTPTDQRLAAYKKGEEDLNLEELYFSFWKVFIDLKFACGFAAGQPAGHMEQRDPSAVEKQLYNEHQPADELLARRSL
jgi:hypothetical protein